VSDKAYIRQILLIFLLLSIAVIGAGTIYVSYGREQLEKAKYGELSSIADLKVNGIQEWIRELERDGTFFDLRANRVNPLYVFLARPDDGALRDDIETLAVFLSNTYGYRGLRLYDRQGALVFRFPARLDHEAAEEFDAAGTIPKDRASVGDFYRVPSDGRIALNLRIPIKDEAGYKNETAGTLVLEIDPNRYLYPLIRTWPISSATGECLLVRRDGDSALFLNDLRFERNAAMRKRMPLEAESAVPAISAVNGKEGGVEGLDYRGEQVIAWTRAIPGTDWKIVAKIDAGEAFAPMASASALVGAAIMGLIASAGAAAYLARSRQRTLLELRASRSDLARLRMAERFEYLSRYANDAIVLLDDTLTIREANESALRLYGFARDDFIGRSFRSLQTEPAPFIETFSAAEAKNGAAAGYRFETRHRRADGQDIWVEISARVFEMDGRRYAQEIIRDATESKRDREALISSMKEKEILLKELHHRTKNNMQVISALLVLQAEEVGDERVRGAFLEMVGRIRSMALVHEKLYQSRDLSTVDIGAYIKELGTLIAADLACADLKLRMDVPPHPIPTVLDIAVPCGLVLNELISNAVKHAFDGGSDNRLDIFVAEDDGMLELKISDNGRGMPPGFDVREQGRMGWQTITAITETQLRGDFTVISGLGTTVVVRFPTR